MKGSKLLSAITIMFLLIAGIVNACSNFLLGESIDAVTMKNLDELLRLLLITLSLQLSHFFLNVFAWRIIFRINFERIFRLKNGIFRSDLNNPSQENYNAANYNTNVDLVYSSVHLARWNMLNLSIGIVLSIATIVYIEPLMLPIAFISSLLPFCVPILRNKSSQRVAAAFAQQNESYQAYVTDRLSGRKSFQRYQVTEKVESEHETQNRLYEAVRENYKKFVNLSNLLNGSIGSFSFLPIIAFGGYLAIQGKISTGQIVTIINLMNFLVTPMVAIAQLMNGVQAARPIERQLYEKLTESFDCPKPREISRSDIELCNVTFGYGEGRPPLLLGFSYRFEQGKNYLINGKSGAGKSTFAKLLLHEVNPTSGEISIGGISYAQLAAEELYQHVGYVSQSTYLFQANVEDNIRFYRPVEPDRIRKAVELLELQHIAMEELMTQESSISGGERQRVGVARGMVDQKAVMIYDEPTAALNPDLEKTVMQAIVTRSLGDGDERNTVIVISHTANPDVLAMFDEVIELDSIR